MAGSDAGRIVTGNGGKISLTSMTTQNVGIDPLNPTVVMFDTPPEENTGQFTYAGGAVTFLNSGYYNIIPQVQIGKVEGGLRNAYGWIQKNTGAGWVNIDRTGVVRGLQGGVDSLFARDVLPIAINRYFNADDQVRVVIVADNTGVEMQAYVDGIDGAFPGVEDIPACILEIIG